MKSVLPATFCQHCPVSQPPPVFRSPQIHGMKHLLSCETFLPLHQPVFSLKTQWLLNKFKGRANERLQSVICFNKLEIVKGFLMQE